MQTQETFVDGRKVEKGLVLPIPSNARDGFKLSFEAVSQDDQGLAWVGVARFAGVSIVETDPMGDYNQAGQEAERLLRDLFIALLRGDQ